ncbi:hypothetical protein Nmel_000360 [Mimus melanotis]
MLFKVLSYTRGLWLHILRNFML